MATQSSQPAGESLSVRVAREIAAHDGVDPTELSPPLYHSLDPAALDALFEPTTLSGPQSGRVRFTYDGKRVTVHGDGEVTVERIDPSADRDAHTDLEGDTR